MTIARAFGQPPHIVALWPVEWIAACQTAMAAESGAAAERQRAADRRSRMQQRGRRGA